MNCTGKRCIMQHDKVDPATCQCVSYCPYATPPKSNADRIRAMTDEELAEWIYQIQDGNAYRKENYLPPLSRTWWLDWLRQEAET